VIVLAGELNMARGKGGMRKQIKGRPAAGATDSAGHPVRRASLLILADGVRSRSSSRRIEAARPS